MDTSQTLAPGTLLNNGDYRISRVLGCDALSITYLAEYIKHKKRVTILEFFPQGMYIRDGKSGSVSVVSGGNDTLVDKLRKEFLSEARRLDGISDDSIDSDSNTFNENRTVYYVTDFIEERDVQPVIHNARPSSFNRGLRPVHTKKRFPTAPVVAIGIVIIVGIIAFVILKKPGNSGNSTDESVAVANVEGAENTDLAKSIHSAPENFDLCVTWKGKVGYITEADWIKLPSSERFQVTKAGIYVSGNGEQFLLSLNDLQETELDWDDAVAKYGDHLPTKSQAEVMANNYQKINNALSVYDGQTMDNHKYNGYWTRSEENSSSAWIVYMLYGTVYFNDKAKPSRVRSVAPVPGASPM